MANNIEKLVEEIKGLTVMELAELVKTLQEELGVSAMPVAAPDQPIAAANGEAAGNAQSEQAAGTGVQTVVLANAGTNKIAVIKALREINPNLGLKEAKDLAEAAPKEVVVDVKADEAKAAKEKLEAAGATVELK
ncbi:MAG: 50S ribosomal protein L7/L12 [Candidatus Blackburnbacteria bacterium RIFCSPHIGHO2_01_FULL_43_15b]|uniref:Large ribosomal subunit protein bL12 n=1 Tax=Candidatus Blackburnbacteria bacterium RIFCSPHIGHO2_01_FULL_43_15b TaxID=1797513 RepID=A0A1G1V1P9_9BACT|nr:MAG: 50S ribosomal protein L7/L12 [Candidatus Blackburnbacteria bacterium RIFCSPHIGHO2_01_FULL_43_15b]